LKALKKAGKGSNDVSMNLVSFKHNLMHVELRGQLERNVQRRVMHNNNNLYYSHLKTENKSNG